MQHSHRYRSEAEVRLARIEGHVRAIRRMIEDDRDCPDLLVQLGAVRAAVERVGLNLLKDHLSSCIVERRGGRRQALRTLDAALMRFLG